MFENSFLGYTKIVNEKKFFWKMEYKVNLLWCQRKAHHPKSEIDFIQIDVSWRFSLKKQFKDQKSVSL